MYMFVQRFGETMDKLNKKTDDVYTKSRFFNIQDIARWRH